MTHAAKEKGAEHDLRRSRLVMFCVVVLTTTASMWKWSAHRGGSVARCVGTGSAPWYRVSTRRITSLSLGGSRFIGMAASPQPEPEATAPEARRTPSRAADIGEKVLVGVIVAVALGGIGLLGRAVFGGEGGGDVVETMEEAPVGESEDNRTSLTFGDSVDFQSIHLTFTGFSCGQPQFGYVDENADVCTLTLRLRNDGNTRMSLPRMSSTIFVGDNHFSGHDTGDYIFPGQVGDGQVEYEIPKGAAPSRIELSLLSPSYDGEGERHFVIALP